MKLFILPLPTSVPLFLAASLFLTASFTVYLIVYPPNKASSLIDIILRKTDSMEIMGPDGETILER